MKFEISVSDVLTNVIQEDFSEQTVIIPDGVVEISKHALKNCKHLTSIILPDSIMKLENEIFMGFTSLASIVLPARLTDIPDLLFAGCNKLKSINIPNGVEKIGYGAFGECSALQSVILPDSLKQLNACAFFGCHSLKNIVLPATLSEIHPSAFDRCSALKDYFVAEGNNRYYSIDGVLFDKTANMLFRYPEGKRDSEYKIPQGIQNIGVTAFAGCCMLKRIVLPASVEQIGDFTFVECKSLESISVDKNHPFYYDKDGVLFDKTGTLLIYPAGKTTPEYAVPDWVKRIRERAFDSCLYLKKVSLPKSLSVLPEELFFGCKNLMSVYIPESVIEIQDTAFCYCSALQSIKLPASLKYFGNYVFDWCDTLENIFVDKCNPCFCDQNGVLFNKNVSTLLRYPEGKKDLNYMVPRSVKHIRMRAFLHNQFLESVILPDEVASIREKTFCACDNLKDLVIPSDVKEIGAYAFSAYRETMPHILSYYTNLPHLTIHAPKGSYTEVQALAQGIRFEELNAE